jgi:hypothetical protein
VSTAVVPSVLGMPSARRLGPHSHKCLLHAAWTHGQPHNLKAVHSAVQDAPSARASGGRAAHRWGTGGQYGLPLRRAVANCAGLDCVAARGSRARRRAMYGALGAWTKCVGGGCHGDGGSGDNVVHMGEDDCRACCSSSIHRDPCSL